MRQYLTVFMWLGGCICIVSVTGYFVLPSEKTANAKGVKVSRWEEPISITYIDDGGFIDFLNVHVGKKVYLSTCLDMSLSSHASYQIASLTGYMETGADIAEPDMRAGAEVID